MTTAGDSFAGPADFRAMLGHEIVEWDPDRAVLRLVLAPRHLNPAGVVHGGVYAALIDSALGMSGIHCVAPGRVRRSVTLSLTTQFLGQASGGTLTATGEKVGGGRSIYFAEGRIVDGEGRVVATGSGSFRYRRGSESPEGVPGEPIPWRPDSLIAPANPNSNSRTNQ